MAPTRADDNGTHHPTHLYRCRPQTPICRIGPESEGLTQAFASAIPNPLRGLHHQPPDSRDGPRRFFLNPPDATASHLK